MQKGPITRPVVHDELLAALRADDSEVDWVYVSPAAFFDHDGARTGTFRVGGDELLTDAEGDCTISYADYVIDLLDEIERPARHNARISLAY